MVPAQSHFQSVCDDLMRFILLFQVVPLHWWPLTRDCIAYGITVTILICIIHDERIEWYEALILVILYGVYILGNQQKRIYGCYIFS